MNSDWTIKIKSRQEAADWSSIIKEKGFDLVFTNGCFDILHPGHLKYLAEAKDLGSYLIVAINSDVSVKQLKGDKRPINSEYDRALALSCLLFVDAVVIFEEATPLEIIKEIVPDVLVKGGDYNIKDIVGKEVVEGNGGTVKTIPFVEGYSTTEIIEKIKNL